MADTTTELEVLDQIVDVLGGQSGQYETVVPVLQQIKELLAAGITDPEAIAEAVTAWLDEHPEATTTVRDGSITVMKLAQDVIELLDSKADIDGYYSQLTAGLAENLIARGDAVPAEYLYRTAGGDADIEDGIATIDCIKGNTLVWNQLQVDGYTLTYYGLTITVNNGLLTVTGTADSTRTANIPLMSGDGPAIPNGHKLLLINTDNTIGLYMQGLSGYASKVSTILTADDYTYAKLATSIPIVKNQEVNLRTRIMLFDLTLMFGAGNEPATVEEFEAMFPLPYYPYSAPKLLPVDIRGIETVGFNLWDEEWEVGAIVNATGQNTAADNRIRSKNYIPCLPNTAYYCKGNFANGLFFYDANKQYLSGQNQYTLNSVITTPSNARYMRFCCAIAYGTTYNHDICINLSWSGYRNGEYEEHWLAERPIDTSRFFPTGMKKVGDKADALYADHYDTVIGAVDLGTLTWNLQIGSTQNYFCSNTYDWLVAGVNNVVADVKCAKYEAAAPNNIADKTINVSTKNRLVIRDDSFNDDVSAFAASLNGVILYYELATPTTTEIDPPLNLSYKVSDFGTERIMVDETADAPQSAPVPMEVEYGINATDTVRRLPTQYISHESFQQFVAALQSAVGITVTETWDENDGRYEYTVTQTGE